MQTLDLSISSLRRQYRDGSLTPSAVVDFILERSAAFKHHNVWITQLSRQQIAVYLDRLDITQIDKLPLFGIPFAIKDNIDLAGIPTTAACPEFCYVPDHSAFVVQQLIHAGAIPIGKTNMDQFATGLVGTRSPYGAVKNCINPDYISGGSSSGSAVATGLGLVTFALGTDTAGSGRVPAMFNNLIGVKPSCGVISSRGVVPACRSIDCVSLFALNPDDAATIYPVLSRYDEEDAFSRPVRTGNRHINRPFRFGVITEDQMQPGPPELTRLMQQMSDQLVALGGTPVPIDFSPFIQAASLLYEGPWVAERYAAIQSLITTRPEVLHPVTRTIITQATRFSAADTFQAIYRLRELKMIADRILADVDFVLTPTASDIYTIKEVEDEPYRLNSLLGFYTNFVNLLDYSAISIPAGKLDKGMPFGVTLFADKFMDGQLIDLSREILAHSGLVMGAGDTRWVPETRFDTTDDSGHTDLLVCGAHLSGMPLNHQLAELNAVLVQATTTAPRYRLYALAGGPPYRPGLVRDVDHGAAISVEVWSIPVEHLGKFLLGIPAPLGLGRVELNDGRYVTGFICEPCAVKTATEITDFGGWRKYIETLSAKTG